MPPASNLGHREPLRPSPRVHLSIEANNDEWDDGDEYEQDDEYCDVAYVLEEPHCGMAYVQEGPSTDTCSSDCEESFSSQEDAMLKDEAAASVVHEDEDPEATAYIVESNADGQATDYIVTSRALGMKKLSRRASYGPESMPYPIRHLVERCGGGMLMGSSSILHQGIHVMKYT